MAVFSLLHSTTLAHTDVGKPTGAVNDFASILSTSERATLETSLRSIYSTTGASVVVATIPSLLDETIETYATQLFSEWGIGDKEKDRGLLILIAPNERQVRIEVGYGLEPVVTDAHSNAIIQKIMLPAFREGKYSLGVSNAIVSIEKLIAGDPDAIPVESKSNLKFDPTVLVYFIFFLLSAIGGYLARTKSWWLGGVIGAGIGVIAGFIFGFIYSGIIAIILLGLVGLAFDYFASKHGGKGGGHWFGGGGFGGRGGGGFGGFGGGMSGGGGSSGRW
jgi:uncharacterized protein